MYYVYVLKDRNNKELYYGFTTDLKRHVREHISKNKGWQLVYYEAYKGELDTKGRENKLKHYGQARSHLKNRIRNSLE
jgi:predicted GIY-YIG superfamily endonuclease